MVTLKTNNREMVTLFNGLQKVSDLQGVRFGLVVSKNIRIIQQELKDLEEASKPSSKFIELSQKVNSLKDDKEAIEKLEEENKELVDARRTQLDEIEKLLDGDIEINLHTITEDILPEHISSAQILEIDKILESGNI